MSAKGLRKRSRRSECFHCQPAGGLEPYTPAAPRLPPGAAGGRPPDPLRRPKASEMTSFSFYRSCAMHGRNCGIATSGIDQSAKASGKKPVLNEKLAASASTLAQNAVFPQLRPGSNRSGAKTAFCALKCARPHFANRGLLRFSA